MYERFYGLTADPFRLSPDHRFCFNHENFARAKAYIDYALHRAEGFVMITGKPGTGKTTLVYDLLDRLAGRDIKVAMLTSTRLGAEDLLRMTAYAFGLGSKASNKAMVLQSLMEFLRQQYQHGKRALLIIDESQDLSASALEELRLLTNLQHSGQPLLQIVLIGQESLRDLVRSREMEQLHQRLLAAWHLEPLGPLETVGYIQHRLAKADWRGDPAFKPGVMQTIHGFSGGLPRMINLFCSRLMLHGFIEELHVISLADAEFVLGELRQEELAPRTFSSVGDLPEKFEGMSTLDAVEQGQADVVPATGSNSDVDWSRIDTGLSMPPAQSRETVARHAGNATDAHRHSPPAPVRTPASGEPSGQESPPSSVLAETRQEPLRTLPLDDAISEPAARAEPRPNEIPQLGQILEREDDTGWTADVMETIASAPSAVPSGFGSSRARPWFLGLGFVFGLGLMGSVAAFYLLEPVAWKPLTDKVEQWIGAATMEVRTRWSRSPDQSGELPPPSVPAALDSLDQARPSSVAPRPTTGMAVTSSPAALGVDGGSSSPLEPIALVESQSDTEPTADTASTEIPVQESRTSATNPSPSLSEEVTSSPAAVAADTAGKPRSGLTQPDLTPRAWDAAGKERRVAADERTADPTEPTDDDAIATLEPELEPSDAQPPEPMTSYVLFGWNSTAVDARFEPMLAEAIAALNRSSEAIAWVVGYSDRYGDAAYNLNLSRRRANAVADYLVEHGAPRERLRVEGRGPRDLETMGNRHETSQSEGRMVELSVSHGEN
ncbi:AAA family ATPase [Thiocystis violascens]|uniref:Type II secretory pathway, component ExeA (Predicted ATPase) n=1 Tax=Thiocystis violascens (strain ATCC 17096 / DSM 198 / 6111) TaxID=765911 RepID=I3YGF6_THIV6|nr:AAA family ATPase [Thiocystis violascens]AFL76074.1 type II secretory pathway, component ExeA (predicted ATPase) [Thiocystis violascens DSM 198]